MILPNGIPIRPMLFSTQMALANIENRKTETRRLVSGKNLKEIKLLGLDDQYLFGHVELTSKYDTYYYEEGENEGEENKRLGPEWLLYDGDYVYPVGQCPYGLPGNFLLQKETTTKLIDDEVLHLASDDGNLFKTFNPDIKWKPSIFMPYEAARHFCKIESIAIERLNEITEQSAVAEGFKNVKEFKKLFLKINSCKLIKKNGKPSHYEMVFWDEEEAEKVNAETYGKPPLPLMKIINPYVWVVRYKNYSLSEFEAELSFNWLEYVEAHRLGL